MPSSECAAWATAVPSNEHARSHIPAAQQSVFCIVDGVFQLKSDCDPPSMFDLTCLKRYFPHVDSEHFDVGFSTEAIRALCWAQQIKVPAKVILALDELDKILCPDEPFADFLGPPPRSSDKVFHRHGKQ